MNCRHENVKKEKEDNRIVARKRTSLQGREDLVPAPTVFCEEEMRRVVFVCVIERSREERARQLGVYQRVYGLKDDFTPVY